MVDRPTCNTVLGITGNAVAQRDGTWYVHHSFGRIVEQLAPYFREIRYFGPQAPAAVAGSCDYPLTAPNITVRPWEVRRHTGHALRRPDRLLLNYWRMCRECDVLFLRGSPPLIWTAHWMARMRGRRLAHWVVANPPAVLRSNPRGYGRLGDAAGLWFALAEQRLLRLSTRVSRAAILANGQEVARLFVSPRTHEVVSTSITEHDFHVRADTCQGAAVRVLYVGFVRPEKGIEYLIRALAALRVDRAVEVAIVGSWGQFAGEYERLRALAGEIGVADAVRWEGHAAFGRELFEQMDRSDLLVLPSLSEGTPRVLVEARARSLPVIATNVGGIPSSVRDGEDGLLVPTRDPAALAQAMTRIISDGELRRGLIERGRERVRGWTVERFVEQVVALLRG
ncbi:MAG: glycosyltransferase family 4 protein [Planctomycetes bacterium]|nr:glycosyltransferase family 4 protein [Planctomycetota bacterium]